MFNSSTGDADFLKEGASLGFTGTEAVKQFMFQNLRMLKFQKFTCTLDNLRVRTNLSIIYQLDK